MSKVSYLLGLACTIFVSILFYPSIAKAEAAPELVISSYEVSGGEAIEGESFELVLKIENVSSKSTVHNVLVSVSNEENLIYSGYGMSNQGYIDSIPPKTTKTLTFVLDAAQTAPDIVKTDVLLSFADSKNEIDTNEATIWLPVGTKGKINISQFTITESIMEGDTSKIKMMLSNADDANISSIRLHVTDNDQEILNEVVSENLTVATTTSYETDLRDLAVGTHKIMAFIEYKGKDDKIYTSNYKTFKVDVWEKTQVSEQENYNVRIYKYGIIILMVICLIIIIQQVKSR